MYSYPLTAYYVPYSCEQQYFPKYYGYAYWYICPNQLRSHGPMFRHFNINYNENNLGNFSLFKAANITTYASIEYP